MSGIYKSGNWYGGGSIEVDDTLSSSSENPVQNKVVKSALDNKVDAVSGKGLSTNDYDDTEKAKVAAAVTKIVNDLVNYYTKTETYSKTEVDAIITAVKNSRFEAVEELPTTDIKTNVIYLVPAPTTRARNRKEEYINTDGTSEGWESLGNTSIDLSGYVTTDDLNTALADYVSSTDLSTTLSNYIQKSNTAGLVKNDGTIDTNQYLTQHQDISSKQNKTLDTSITVDGIPQTTVEDALNAINNKSGSGGVLDFDDLTNRPQESDAIDIDDLDLPMPAKPTEYPVLFDETGTEYQVGYYKRASDGKVKPVWRKDVLFSNTITKGTLNSIAHNIQNIEILLPKTIGKFIDSQGYIRDTNSYFGGAATWCMGYVDNTNCHFYIETGFSQSISKVMFEIYFTRTTDEWKEV